MNPKSKTLKIACILQMIFGIVVAIAGIAALVGQDGMVGGCAATADGVVLCILGARCSILANVPSNAKSLFRLALVSLIVGIVCAAACVVPQDSHLYLAIATCIGAVISLVIVLIDHSIINDQKQV